MLDISRNKRIIALLPLAIFGTLLVTPMAHAYGAANWQVGFAGTFTGPGGNNGFWGWCAFAGGTGSPATSGTDADCQISEYFGPGHSLQVEESIKGTAWTEGPCTLQPCQTATDFYITDGVMTLAGPTVVEVLQAGLPLPPSCTVSGAMVTCPIPVWEFIGIFSPDTGIPTAAGHYNLNSFFNHNGEIQVQVVQLT